MQKHSDEQAGTRVQQRMKKSLREKQTAFKSKYNTFKRLVDGFNADFPDGPVFDCPSFENCRALSVYDPFWDVGQLTHPGEAWAVDPKTQEGIQAYLAMTHAHDELTRVGRECCQMIKWAASVKQKISVLCDALALRDDNVSSLSNTWIIKIGGSVKADMAERLAESKEVLLSLLAHLTQTCGRLWITWNVGMMKIVNKTLEYSRLSPESETDLKIQWTNLASRSREAWRNVVEAPILEAEPLDVDEADEMGMDDMDFDEEQDRFGWFDVGDEDEGDV
ncbi:uncharacterized protein MELLADRAFT_78703 [Melampsora larici-populina 98AG31]|uniref:Uncharacterized protein n=1 Tax=Melampsora larici-populina (strain 98AG31 / pathotype 3-4-7) TaxID=747676 RepID=F4RXK8_MELLP|nr:uncharacterized protein MELLADRAFT_78703 [Melampsora larici-populina 98AG31]EGG02740.1 hypothetical protein MELLADRAFT_78703 [Melampsora larici-populina 98AG31]